MYNKNNYNLLIFWKKMLAISIPLMLAESVNSILWITDTYFVGKLGDYAIEAIGMGGYLSWLTFTAATPLYIGALVLVAQAYGADKREEAEHVIGELLGSSIILSIPLLVLFYFSAPYLIDVMAGKKVSEIASYGAVAYFHARVLALPFLYMSIVFDSVFRGLGETKQILYSTIIFTLTNIILDPILIYGLFGIPKLGVRGAGYASAIAIVIYMLSLAIQFRKTIFSRIIIYFPKKYLKTIINIGLPMLAERLTGVTAHFAYLSSIARCGNKALAAHTIGIRIESLAFLPLFSLGEAAASIIGHLIGAGKPDKAYRSGITGAGLAILLGSAIGLLLAGLSRYLPMLFTSDPETIRLASLYLTIAGFSEPFFAVSVVLLMSVRGAGNTRYPLLVNTLSMYLYRVSLPILFLIFYSPNIVLFWMFMLADQVTRAIASIILFKYKFNNLYKKLI